MGHWGRSASMLPPGSLGRAIINVPYIWRDQSLQEVLPTVEMTGSSSCILWLAQTYYLSLEGSQKVICATKQISNLLRQILPHSRFLLPGYQLGLGPWLWSPATDSGSTSSSPNSYVSNHWTWLSKPQSLTYDSIKVETKILETSPKHEIYNKRGSFIDPFQEPDWGNEEEI